MKKLTILFISLLNVLNISAEIYSGSCGINANYTLDTETGVLSITGTGAMTDYDFQNVPWWSYRSYVKTVKIADGITSIGYTVFYKCSGLTSITIPNSVKTIGGSSFSGCSGLTSIEIPNSVTSIGEAAFYNCFGLKSITIPNSVTTLQVYVFSGCSGLKSVIIPNSVKSIEESAFDGCSSLTSIEIPNSVTSIGYGTFSDCSDLTSVIIPNSVTSIGEKAFYGCYFRKQDFINNSSLNAEYYQYWGAEIEDNGCIINAGTLTKYVGNEASVTIPNSVKLIGNSAFYGCSVITSITIPNSVTSIGSSAFCGCYFEIKDFINNSKLDAEANNYWGATIVDSRENGFVVKDGVLLKYTGNEASVTIPNSVTSIGDEAFIRCNNLTSITIGNSVTSIGKYAFSGCSNLTSVDIPNSVTSIGKYAFSGCFGLTSVAIPNSVTSIENDTFNGCFGLTKVELNSNAIVSKIYNSLSIGYIFGSQVKEYVIGDDVTSIGHQAFQYCSNMTSITIGNSVTSIYSTAFYKCSGLTKVTLNSNAIVSRSYSSDSSLKDIFGNQVKDYIIGNDVTTIGNYAFIQCSDLTTITFGSNVENIGDYAFANNIKLNKIYCYAENVPTTSRSAFENSYLDYVTLYVPGSSLDAYKSTAPWKNAASILPLEDIKEKCATPTIIYENGKLSFHCETEGVEYVYSTSSPSTIEKGGIDVSLPTTITINVYAKKNGYEDSDVATKDIDVSGFGGIRGDANQDGEISMQDAMFIVNYILKGSFPDENIELEKAGVRFGFYGDMPEYFKINKIDITGLRHDKFGTDMVGSTIGTSADTPTFDRADGSYTNVYFEDSNDNSSIIVEIGYSLNGNDYTYTYTDQTDLLNFKPNKNYTVIINFSLHEISVSCVVEGQDGLTR